MQTDVTPHDTDQNEETAMNINPNHGNNRKEKQMNAITRATSIAVLVALGLTLSTWAAEIDRIVPVPLTAKRLRERGFNQSLLLARVLSKMRKIPLLMDMLLKKKETPPQIGISANERLLNLRNAFEVNGDIKGLRLLLVDDVMTSGATLCEGARNLRGSGAGDVHAVTLCHTEG